MKLLDNFNGQQASHSSRRAVRTISRFDLEMEMVRLEMVRLEMLRLEIVRLEMLRLETSSWEMLTLAEWNGPSQPP